jgi:D-beta-D-heptose 7-phosphate kinase/D-beta-D-heptose 1-phosphate adenosyltransferase
MTIAVIGDFILDQYIYGKVNRISPESPIPVFEELNTEYRPGGSGNVVENLKALGAHVVHYHSKQHHSIKKRYVCDYNVMFRSDDEKYIINEDINFDLTGVKYTILSDYNKGFLHHSQSIIQYCQSHGCVVVVDPKKHLSHYRNANYVKLNDKEIVKYTDGEDYQTILEKYNIGALVVTQGSRGVFVYSPEFQGNIPVQSHNVKDVTGAGDVFISTMTFFLSKGKTLKEAAIKANTLASLSVTKFGTYILTPQDIRQIKVVFTNGCFDILHKGHVEYLRKSRQLGSRLVVGLNSDDSVRKLKGVNRPINNQEDRKAVLESLDCVDEVIIFDEETPLELIKQINPDVITKGGDYKRENVVGGDLCEVVIIPTVEGKSTTNIINKMNGVKNDAT